MVYDFYAAGAEDQWTFMENRDAFSRILHCLHGRLVVLKRLTLQIYKDWDLVQQLIQRAEKAGYKPIVLTVDAPWLGRRKADVRNRFNLPQNVVLKTFEGLDQVKTDQMNGSGFAAYVASQVDRSFCWKVKSNEELIAIECGAAGIIMSNHGGRQLDYLPATISCLEEVVREANGRVPVFIDSGFRRGTDVFKALVVGSFRSIYWQAGAILPRRRRRGRREERAADAEGRAGGHHGAERLHVGEGDHVVTESDRIRRCSRL